MPGSGPSRSRSLFSGRLSLAAALTLMLPLAAGGCPAEPSPPEPLTSIDGQVLDRAVVRMLEQRDGLSEADATTRAIETLRLAAAARAQQVERGQEPGLAPHREEHLRRTALARLWLRERFEATHGVDDIPADEPTLARARNSPRMVHPELYKVCQILVTPPKPTAEEGDDETDDGDTPSERDTVIDTRDPQWRAAAQAALAPVLERVQRGVPVGDIEACPLIGQHVSLSPEGSDPNVVLSFERAGGFDLDACAETAEDGSCTTPSFAPEWTAAVRGLATVPGLSSPFFTRFGLHVVYVHERLPARLADDPATEVALREAIVDGWRAQKLGEALSAMEQKRAVRVADSAGAP